MGLSNKKSVLAVVKETTEAVPVSPTSDYIALQDGFEMEPSFNELENEELTGTIGKAKTAVGSEDPSASVSHYLRHSGTEGLAPDYGLFMESLLGAVKVVAVEELSEVGSVAGDEDNRGSVEVGVGDGASFDYGQAMLIKDGTNGYKIRNVYNVSTDSLELNFNIDTAPASGVGLGKPVMYYPIDENHPTMSMWLYRANGGAIEMQAGTRTTEMAIDVTAGEYINANYSFGGVEYYFNPLEVTASSSYIDFTEAGLNTYAVQIDLGIYKDTHELAEQLEAKMNSTASAFAYEVKYLDASGKYEFTSTDPDFELIWNSGVNSANSIGPLLGFDVADSGTGLVHVSDNGIDLSSPQTPVCDSQSPLVAKSNEIMIGDFADTECFQASTVSISVSGEKADINSICAESGKSGSILSGRDVEIEVQALLEKYEVEYFKRFREGQETAFMYNLGEKSGGNWTAGKCVNIYCPTATISSYKLEDQDGLVALTMSLKPYVKDCKGEIFINFL
jgi:hypothetical protein